MFAPADAMLYFYLLMGMRYVDINDFDNKVVEKPYRAYTTTLIITNNDMYSLDEINDIILTSQAQQELKP